MTKTERLTQDRDEARKWVVLYGQAFERLRAAVAEFESTHEAIQFFVDRSPSELAAEAKEATPPTHRPAGGTAPDETERPAQAPEQAPGAASMPAHVVQPLDLVLWAREALRGGVRGGRRAGLDHGGGSSKIETADHEVTDNRHPATENDPGRGSATAEKP